MALSKKSEVALFILMMVIASTVYGQGTPTGQSVTQKVCSILNTVKEVLQTIGGTLVIIMFIYGGLKYVFSADDPGGRKSGKMTCIHAIIGGILIVIATDIVGMISMSSSC